jgi:hypothetical protein
MGVLKDNDGPRPEVDPIERPDEALDKEEEMERRRRDKDAGKGSPSKIGPRED